MSRGQLIAMKNLRSAIAWVPHPIPYQGSKRWIARAIISCFPKGTEKLIEPFAGSAAVTLAAACYRKASRFHINDINGPLIDLWRKIINEPDALSDQYGRLWREQLGKEREYYDQVRAKFNQMHRPDCFLYLLARCVKAAIRYNAKGEFNNSPDNRRKGAHPDTMRAHVLAASQLLKGKTYLSSQDYRIVLGRATPSDVVYMDPPYQGVCGNRDQRYLGSVSFNEFAEALSLLNDKGISYIVSYDGRTGQKTYGHKLPESLQLVHLEVEAGRSSQATLLGRESTTYESLYLSPAIMSRIGQVPPTLHVKPLPAAMLSLAKA
jgi:DNA adenine methylase